MRLPRNIRAALAKQHGVTKPQKPSKYRNKIVVRDGIKFHSKREADRWGILKALEKHGSISQLRRQVPYQITVNGVKICKYVADAVYVEDGAEVVEDTKGVRTRDYRLKAKLMLACHRVAIRET